MLQQPAEDVIVRRVSELKRIAYMHSFEKLDRCIRKCFHSSHTVIKKVAKFFEVDTTGTRCID